MGTVSRRDGCSAGVEEQAHCQQLALEVKGDKRLDEE
jgi:hypothetical protein